jgi:multisubunit Na+/H+ antiporter MnhB subunit
VARVAAPLTLYVSAIIFFQGHNLPGGGFIAGVLAAIAGAVIMLAFGPGGRPQFAWWCPVVIAVLLVPVSGLIAAAIALATGLLFRASLTRPTIGQCAWWRMSVVGVLISVGTGVALMFISATGSFMDHTAWHIHVPLLGDEHLPTATFFDLGVYLIVAGTLMTIFVELALEEEQQ